MGTIVVPPFAHYRSPNPPVQAALAGGLPSTLAKLRCYGGGPRFAKAGPRLVIYDRSDLDAWLKSRTCHTTSEYRSSEGVSADRTFEGTFTEV
jgi:hypothetical protein